jgi:predicted GIY-YIG superfamily endonuclease
MLKSLINDQRYYVGMTNNLKRRLKEHNNGDSTYSNKYKPWKLITYLGFNSKIKALHFETYLKSHSGRAFAKKHF